MPISSVWLPSRGPRIVSPLPSKSLMNPPASSTLDRIRARKARIGVIGLGYVGLPLAVEFSRAGFDVTGFDVDENKNGDINGGRGYIPDRAPAGIGSAV